MKTKQDIILARRLKFIESCHVPCLFCGSDDSHICKLTSADSNYIEQDCYCTACDHEWVELCDDQGFLVDIQIPKVGSAWTPEDLK